MKKLLIGLLLTSSIFSSEVLKYENPELKSEDSKKWSVGVAGWYQVTSGNADLVESNGSSKIRYFDGITEFFAAFNFLYNQTAQDVNERSLDATVQYDKYIIPRVELFFLSRSEHIEKQSLHFRQNTGVGAKLGLVRNKLWWLDVSAAPIHQYEDITGIDISKDVRMSYRAKSVMYPVSFLELNSTFFWIPDLQNHSNYRIDWRSYVKIKLSQWRVGDDPLVFSIKFGYNYWFNTNPGVGNLNTDEVFFTQFGIDF